jgi:hypothetical protein
MIYVGKNDSSCNSNFESATRVRSRRVGAKNDGAATYQQPRRSYANAARERVLRLVLLAGAVVAGVATGGTRAQSEPLVTQGIGTSSCARVAADVHPAQGLTNPVNLMLYAWVQGYVSAANLALLGNDAEHLDISAFDDDMVLNLVLSFCKANPDKRPIAAIDELIRKSAKIKPKAAEAGTILWHE